MASLSTSLLPQYTPQQLSSASALAPTSFPISFRSAATLTLSVKPPTTITCLSTSQAQAAVATARADSRITERSEIRLGLPSKGRMADDTLDLLKDCQLHVKQVNPRQYVAEIPQLSNLEVWFQRPKDIVRKLLSGDLDLGFVGLDTVSEYGQGNEDLIIVHDDLEYGDCRLSLA
ncbi:hypothetical protein CRG98_004641, partial [Punica granatum]